MVSGGRLDAGRLRAYLESVLDGLPRYRQRLARVPIVRHPVWVDDRDFDLDRHLRVEALPEPGSRRELDDLVGRLMSEDLDRHHPPWQLVFVEGLAEGRFAVVARIHHSLVDGVAGVRLLESMLRGTPEESVPERRGWQAEPALRRALLGDELAYRRRALATLARGRALGKSVAGGARLLATGLRRASDAGVNPRRNDRARAFASTEMELAAIKAIKNRFDATVNDVVLAIAAGALRRTLSRRGVDVDFRAMVPVSTHDPGDPSTAGNKVLLLLVPLPVAEPDPVRRLERIRDETRARKESQADLMGGDLLVRLSEATTTSILSAAIRLTLRRRGFNVLVTNVPGPPFPLYLLGAPLRSFHVVVNVWPRQAVAMALFSYAGTLSWGVHSDREAVPEVDEIAGDLVAAFEDLRSAGQA